jgi:CRISPR type III-A-associated RAMP protein Csm3
LVWLIDFENPENNDFIVANQFTVIENGNNKRPDVILFVNGIPLVVIELKNPADENATVKSAFKQLQTYKEIIPSLFTYNGFMVISDGLEAKAGSLSAGLTRFMAWKSADGKEEASNLISQLETLINGMLNKETLLDLIRHFIVFEKSKKEDAKTGIVSISTVKKLAAYHQYYAVNRAVESALRATGYSLEKETPVSMVMESPASYGVAGVKSQPKGDRKGGVVWHTQGSGKSLSMVFFTGKIVLKTGLHIGAGDVEMHIGGTDNPVLKHPFTNEPYIPGSSLKGKVRSLLELQSGLMGLTGGQPISVKTLGLDNLSAIQKEFGKKIIKLFGASGADADDLKNFGPARVSFSDCFFTEEVRQKVKEGEMVATEIKAENSINRISSTAQNPRFTERVPAGISFNFTITLKKFGTFYLEMNKFENWKSKWEI